MRNKNHRFLSLLLAAVLVLCLIPAIAFAAAEKLAYDGDAVGFFKEDLTSAFGMLTPQEGSTCEIDGDNVVIHIVPKNTTTYNAIHWGAITDELSADVKFNEDGTIDLKLAAADYCGYAHPVAPVKADGSGTTSTQYYFAIPAKDKLPEAEKKVEKLAYSSDAVGFFKEDLTSAFGMLTPQEGSTCEIDGDNVVIHIVPKNTTVYNALHWGAITDELTKDVTFNEDGTIDLKLAAADYCGYASPVAPVKADGSGTTSAQYYLAIPAKDKLPEVEKKVEKLAYTGADVAFLKEDLTSKFGMLTPQDGSYWALDGDNVVIHIIPKNTTVYNSWHWGAITDELTKDVTFNEDGSIDLKLAAADYCGFASPVAPIKVKDGKTTADQYYLAVPAKDKLSTLEEVKKDLEAAAPVEEKIEAIGEVTLESEEKIAAAREAYDALTDAQKKLVANAADLTAAEEALKALKEEAEKEAAKHIELTITNNTNMFKAVTAFLDTADDGTQTLVVALSGTSYENLFKGNYEEAKANGNDRTKWIKAETNADGKLEFKIPVGADESYLPLVSISNSYLAKFEAGENPIERAFYPRQMVIDREAKTLVVGDYENSKDLEIVNNVKMFKPSSAKLTTVGGPNSNNYAAILDLVMGSDSFDKAFIGTKDEAAAAKEGVVSLDNKTFSFKLKWVVKAGDPDSVVDLMKDTIIVSFHSVKNDAWYERQMTVSESKGRLTFNEAAADDDSPVKVVTVKDKSSEPVPFTLGEVEKNVELTIPVAVKVNPDVDDPESIDIKWQKDIVLPADTTFPVTIEFEYENKSQNFFIYHYDTEKKVWEVVGKGKEGKATVTFNSLSPVALVAVNTPNTGDSAAPYLWGAAAVVFAAAAVVLIARRRKEEN